LREATRRNGTLLLIDETHTLSSGPGGYTATHGLEPDFLVVGKSIGGGIPVGLYGTSEEVAQRLWREVPKVNPATVRQSAHLGFGGTLAGSALQVAAVRAVLEQVLTPEAFAHMSETALALAAGMRAVVSRHRLPWSVIQLGARVELMFSAGVPTNATDVAAGRDEALEALLHIYFMNRGVLVTPFHCMLLMCPATSDADARRFVSVLDVFCDEIARLGTPGTPP
jgi:glutamate-1-semialdehyde 2,1-aminomutase